MSEEIAKFRFKKYFIHKSTIEIFDLSNIDKKLDIEIKRTNIDGQNDNIYKLLFEIIITDKNKSLNINLKIEGHFEFDKDVNDEALDSFININAPAILFPYVRAYISTLTALSGITPIILPTINLSNRQ